MTGNAGAMTAPGEHAARWVRPAAVFAIAAFCLSVMGDNRADVDLWGNTGFVKAPAWSDAYLRANTFSFTEPDRPWINHEWLAELLFWQAFRAGGGTGLILLKLLLAAGLVLVLYPPLRTGCRSGPTGFLFAVLLASAAGYGYGMRPHHFTFLLYAVFVRVLLPPVTRPLPAAGAAGLCLLFVLWANLHGAFFIGLVPALVVALCATVRALRRTDGAAAAAARAWGLFAALVTLSLANPYGAALWSFIRGSAALFRPYLSEWSPFLPRHAAEHPDFLILALLVAAAVWRARRLLRAEAIVLLALALGSAFLIRRNIPLFAITAALCAPAAVDRLAGAALDRLYARLRPAAVAGLLAAAGLFALLHAGALRTQRPLQVEIPPGRFPEQSVAWLRANQVQGNMLAFFDWAEYAIWHLYPDVRQFLDGRLDSAYSRDVIDDYLAFIYQQGDAGRALAAYPTDIVLVHPRNPAAAALRGDPAWAAVLTTKTEALFLRRDRHAALVARPPLAPPEPATPAGPPTIFP